LNYHMLQTKLKLMNRGRQTLQVHYTLQSLPIHKLQGFKVTNTLIITNILVITIFQGSRL
jgi:hypothetical protein